jgi:hypothetical protein
MKPLSHDVRVRLAAWVSALDKPVTIRVTGRHAAMSIKTGLYNAIKLVKDGKVTDPLLEEAAREVSVFTRPVKGYPDQFDVTLQTRSSLETLQVLERAVAQELIKTMPVNEQTPERARQAVATGLDPQALADAMAKARASLDQELGPLAEPAPSTDGTQTAGNPFYTRGG